MAAIVHQKRQNQRPSIFEASAHWTATALFGLALGLVLLVFDSGVFTAVEWLVQISHSGPNSISTATEADVKDGITTWGWAGLVVGAILLPVSNTAVRSKLAKVFGPIVSRRDDGLLPPDRAGPVFFVGIVGVLVFAVLAHWSLRTFVEVDWLESEDGLSEWWSVATYLAGALAAGAAAWYLRTTKQSAIKYLYLVLAVGFFLGALEEISWGQRLAGWSTPAALEEINFQDETTLHNVNFADNVIFEALFWGSVFGLIGGLWRLEYNLRGISDRMRLILPSLVLAPALLLIMVWRTGDIWQTANIPRLLWIISTPAPAARRCLRRCWACVSSYTLSPICVKPDI